MAVPAFATVGAFANSASAASLAPALPASLVANNILISFVAVKSTGKTITASGVWTIGDSINANSVSAAWAWALALGGGLDVACTFSWTGSAACSGQCIQYSGNDIVSPVNTSNKASADSSTTETIAALTTGADNCRVLDFLHASSSQTIPVPADFTSRATTANANGSIRLADASIAKAGTTSAQSVAITSANWASFGIAILGSGSGVSAVRSSQNVLQVLESYSDPTNIRASQVVLQVLRSVATAHPTSRTFIIG